ncbi:MAG: class F420-dependent oxidoreductase [Schumannella sp.]|nr:class F420-dependent oxidoreductase [Schumannella sp.]
MSPSRPLRVGVQIAPQHATYAQLRDCVARLEDMGVDIIFNWDHFFPLSGDPDGLHFEAWTMLAAMAEQTSRVEFGPLVNCNSYRNPDLQADMARTIDHISARDGVGRFIFGTGSGWKQKDYDEYGYEFGTAGSRLDALAEDLPRIRARWDRLNPAPTRRIPILIGGGGERKTLKIVAEHADIWHSFADPETLVHKLGVLRTWCAEVGRDPDEIELSTGVSVRGLGSGKIAVLEQQYELGVRLMQASVSGPAFDYEPVTALLAWRDSAGV